MRNARAATRMTTRTKVPSVTTAAAAIPAMSGHPRCSITEFIRDSRLAAVIRISYAVICMQTKARTRATFLQPAAAAMPAMMRTTGSSGRIAASAITRTPSGRSTPYDAFRPAPLHLRPAPRCQRSKCYSFGLRPRFHRLSPRRRAHRDQLWRLSQPRHLRGHIA